MKMISNLLLVDVLYALLCHHLILISYCQLLLLTGVTYIMIMHTYIMLLANFCYVPYEKIINPIFGWLV
jgi:hypothetical protein